MVGVIPVDGGEHRWVSTALDRPFYSFIGFQAPAWLDDETPLATAEDRGDTHLFRIWVDASPPEHLTEGPLSVYGFAAAGVVATPQSTVRCGVELFVERNGVVEEVTSCQPR